MLAYTSAFVLAQPEPAVMWLGAPDLTRTGAQFSVAGEIHAAGDLTGQTVSIYEREMGENSDTLLVEAPITYSTAGNLFGAKLPALTHSAIITATWGGNSSYSTSSVWTYVRVRAKVTLRVKANSETRLRLRSEITPLQPHTGPSFGVPTMLVRFQRKVGGRWTSMGTGKSRSTDGESWVQTTYYHLKPGVYVLRARFIGTDYNAAAVSKTLSGTFRSLEARLPGFAGDRASSRSVDVDTNSVDIWGAS